MINSKNSLLNKKKQTGNKKDNSSPFYQLFLVIVISAGVAFSLPWFAEGRNSEERTALLKQKARSYYWGLGVTQNYSESLRLYRLAAALGDKQASMIAGGMYLTGKGVAPDPVEAFAYLDYGSGAQSFLPDAEVALATLYFLGLGGKKSDERAVELYRSAAEKGHLDAQLELGYLYYSGQGVDQDYQQALYWFEKAAMNGYPMAQYNLGIVWYSGDNGQGTPRLVDSLTWMNLAADNGFQPAVVFKNFLRTELRPEEVIEATRKSAQLARIITNNSGTGAQ